MATMSARKYEGRDESVLRHVPLQLNDAPAPSSFGGSAVKGGLKGGTRAASTVAGRTEDAMTGRSDAAGRRELWIVVRKNAEATETPVLLAGPQTEGESVAVFPSREKASLYIQVARWQGSHEAQLITPTQLSQCLPALKDGGIRYLMIDPNRHAQEEGRPQELLALEKAHDLSGENLLQEVYTHSK